MKYESLVRTPQGGLPSIDWHHSGITLHGANDITKAVFQNMKVEPSNKSSRAPISFGQLSGNASRATRFKSNVRRWWFTLALVAALFAGGGISAHAFTHPGIPL